MKLFKKKKSKTSENKNGDKKAVIPAGKKPKPEKQKKNKPSKKVVPENQKEGLQSSPKEPEKNKPEKATKAKPHNKKSLFKGFKISAKIILSFAMIFTLLIVVIIVFTVNIRVIKSQTKEGPRS